MLVIHWYRSPDPLTWMLKVAETPRCHRLILGLLGDARSGSGGQGPRPVPARVHDLSDRDIVGPQGLRIYPPSPTVEAGTW